MALGLAQRVPRPVLDAVSAVGAWEQAWRPGAGVRQWQRTVATMTGVAPDRRTTRRAVASWARNLIESAQLASWSPEEIVERVEIAPGDRERLLATHHGTGAVVALPHLGSWDHAGAWACLTGMPVSSVAEQLPPADYEFFAAARQAVGMRIYPHRDPHVIARLIDDCRAGRLVCLLADRNFSRSGIEVDWPTPQGSQTGARSGRPGAGGDRSRRHPARRHHLLQRTPVAHRRLPTDHRTPGAGAGGRPEPGPRRRVRAGDSRAPARLARPATVLP